MIDDVIVDMYTDLYKTDTKEEAINVLREYSSFLKEYNEDGDNADGSDDGEKQYVKE